MGVLVDLLAGAASTGSGQVLREDGARWVAAEDSDGAEEGRVLGEVVTDLLQGTRSHAPGEWNTLRERAPALSLSSLAVSGSLLSSDRRDWRVLRCS